MYEDGAIINVKATDDQIRERDGFLEILAPPRKPKLGFDSYAGWLAYVMPNDTLFVKRFPAYPDRVYNEAAGLTLSVWYPPGRGSNSSRSARASGWPRASRRRSPRTGGLLSHPFPKAGEKIDLANLRQQVEGLE